MLLRLGASPDQAYGSTKVQLYAADNLVFLLGAVFAGTRRSDLRLFLYLVLAVAAATASLMVVKLLSGIPLVAAVGGRFSLAATEYPIYLGRTSADGIIIAFYAILAAATVRTRLLAMMALPVLIAALLSAGSRGPVVALMLGLVIFAAFAATNRRARRRMLLIAGVLVVTAMIVPLVVPGSVLTRSLSAILGGTSGLSSNGRFTLWSQAYTTFEQHSFLGIGTGGFGALSAENLYPHNLFLEIAAELGLVGLVVIVGIVGSLAMNLIATWRAAVGTDRLDVAVIFALFTDALVNALLSGAVQDNVEIWIWGGVGVGMSARLATRRLRSRRGNGMTARGYAT